MKEVLHTYHTYDLVGNIIWAQVVFESAQAALITLEQYTGQNDWSIFKELYFSIISHCFRQQISNLIILADWEHFNLHMMDIITKMMIAYIYML